MNQMLDRIRRLLRHQAWAWIMAALAVGICWPSLRMGWVLDDYFLRAALSAPEQIPQAARSPAELFAWLGGDWPSHPDISPWWTPDDYRVAFLRPLAGYSHWLDHMLWSDRPDAAHVHSWIWRFLGVLAAAALFRRLARPGEVWVAGLALWIFAMDLAHGIPTIWISNRSSLLAVFFGLLTLYAYHRFRREGWGPGAWIAPFTLGMAVLSAEVAVACGAYLLSYAVFMDRGPWAERLKALLPCAGVGLVWLMFYRAMGYGARSSGAYVDPAGEPLRFLGFLVERGPILLRGQLGWPPPDGFTAFSQTAAQHMWWLSVGFLIFVACASASLWLRDAQARFWLVGALLSVVPSCAMYPGSRLLVYVSIGASAFSALFVAHAWGRSDAGSRRARIGRWALRALTVPLLWIHLVQQPMIVWTQPAGLVGLNNFLTGMATSLPRDEAVARQHSLIVGCPSTYYTFYASSYQVLQGRKIAQETLTLSTGFQPTEVHRPDDRTLVVRPKGGFLRVPGTAPAGEPVPRSSFRHTLQTFDRVFYAGRPFRVGDRIQRHRVTAEITAVTEDARPAEVTFHFEAPLEDPRWRWLQWQSGEFVDWVPPSEGRTVTIEPRW